MGFSDANLEGPFVMPKAAIMGLPNGGRTRYVYSDASGNGIASLSDVPAGMQDMSDLSVASALGKCRANRGDVIVCLPGHVETIGAAAWTTVAGVSVIGLGNGDERPTFNWTAAGSQIVFNSANFRVSNVVMNLAATAATSTTKAIQVSGARNVFDNLKIVAGAAGGTQVATLAIELVTGADRTKFWGCEAYAPTDAACVDFIKLTNAVDWCEVLGCDFDIGMSATTKSLITMTTAPTNMRIGSKKGPYQGCYFRNSIASSTKAFVDVASATGWIDNLYLGIEAASGAASAATINGSWHIGDMWGTVPGKYRLAAGTVST